MGRILSVILQWLVVAAAVVLVVRLFTNTENLPPDTSGNWTQWEGFMAIGYTGIGRDAQPDLIGREQLRRQMQALSEAGYVTVSTQDVADFLDRGKPLPEKALYVMFEGGRKDSFLFAHPVLRELRLKASVYVPTGVLHEWNRFFLRKDDLGKIAANGHWTVESLGNEPYRKIPSGPGGQERPYLTGPAYDAGTGALETPEAMAARIDADYKASAAALADLTGQAPRAFCFYPANTLDVSMQGAAREANRAEIERYYDIAFVREGSPFNSRGADPRDLTRLRVTPDMSPERLLALLQNAWPRARPYEAAGAESVADWVAESGKVTLQDGALHLSPGEDDEAFAWLSGTETWRDAAIETTFTAEAGASPLIYLMYESRSSYLRIVLGHDCITLQERLGERMRNLATVGCFLRQGEPHAFKAVIKGNRLLARLDGADLLDAPLPLTTYTPRGRVAIGVAASNGGAAVFQGFRAELLAPVWLACDDYTGLPEALRTRAADVLFAPEPSPGADVPLPPRIQVLSALSEGAQANLLFECPGPESRDSAESALDRVLAAARAMPGLSGVVVRPGTSCAPEAARELGERIGRAGLRYGLMAPPDWVDGLLAGGRAPEAAALLLEAGGNANATFMTRLLHVYPRENVYLPEAGGSPSPGAYVWRTAAAR